MDAARIARRRDAPRHSLIVTALQLAQNLAPLRTARVTQFRVQLGLR
jgi:hypothetical protein